MKNFFAGKIGLFLVIAAVLGGFAGVMFDPNKSDISFMKNVPPSVVFAAVLLVFGVVFIAYAMDPERVSARIGALLSRFSRKQDEPAAVPPAAPPAPPQPPVEPPVA